MFILRGGSSVLEVNVLAEMLLSRTISDKCESVTSAQDQIGAYNYAMRVDVAFADES